MPIIPVRGVGSAGIVRDTPSVLLPPEAWSNGRNVRFDNSSVSKMQGHEEMFTLTAQPTNLIYWPRPVTQYYVYATDTTVHRVQSDGTVSQIGTGFTTGGVWQSVLFNGGYTVVMNNGIDEPHYITYGTDGRAQELTLQPLPDWPSTLAARVVKTAGYALIAGNLTDTSGAFTSYQPGTIRISSQAAPGGVPSSWTIGTELLTTADEFELSQTSDIRDIVDLRGYTLVFTGNSIHRVQIASQGQPTRVQNLNTGRGVLATDCAIEFDGKVFAVDVNDIYTTGGSGGIESVADERTRDYFFSRLNPTHMENTFVVRNLRQDEIWIIYPTVDSTDGRCDEALIWNYHNNTWTIRDMPGTLGGTIGPRVVSGAFSGDVDSIIFTGYENNASNGVSDRIHAGDRTNQFNGDNFNAFVERTRFDLGDLMDAENLAAVYPLMEGTGSITYSFRATNQPGQSVDFDSQTDRKIINRTFSIADDYKVDPRNNGRFLNMRISSNSNDSWILAGYSLSTTDGKQRR